MLEQRLPAVTSVLAAGLAASCCILPIGLIGAGVASAGLMMSMMRYEWLTLPLGVVGLGGSFAVYVKEAPPLRQCGLSIRRSAPEPGDPRVGDGRRHRGAPP